MNFYILRALFIFSFLVSNAQNLEYSYLTVPSTLKENANAVVRLEATTINLHEVDNMEIIYRRVITIFNESGNRLLQAGVGYDNSRKVTSIQASVYDKLGNEIKKIKSKDFRDQTATGEGTLYSDSRILYMDYTPLQYPYTVDFSYTLKTSVTVFIPSWTPLLNYYESVQKCTYTINNLRIAELYFKAKNFEGYDIENTSEGNKISYSLKNLKAFKREDLSPSIRKIVPVLMVASKTFNANGIYGEASNWQDYGKWMYDKILAGRNELTTETINTVKQITQGIEDKLEKAKIIHKYVQDNTRYISVQVGVGGYQPISALEVDKVKYGDCKGLTNYTQALLEVAGVQAYYTHVESGRIKENLEHDFASLSQGDHVILNIPLNGKDYWIDCTSQVHPFNFVGDFTDDRDVLVMTPEGGIIKHTPKYLDATNSLKSVAKIRLDAQGGINGVLKLQSKGIVYDNRFQLERLSTEDRIKHYKYYWDYINNLNINNVELKNAKDSILFQEKLDVAAQSYAGLSGERILFAPNIFDKEVAVPDRYRNRILDFEIERGTFHESEFEIVLPEGYQIEAKPDNIKIESNYGTYNTAIEIQNNVVYYKRSYLRKHGKYPKEEYKAFRDFIRKVARHDNAKIVLLKITR
jgi:hypothetical protein